MPSPSLRAPPEAQEPNSSAGCGLLTLFQPRNRDLTTPPSSPSRQPPRRCNAARYTAIIVRPTNLPKPAIKPKPDPKPGPVTDRGISGDLDSFLFDYDKTNIGNKFMRATSGNVLVYGELGNLGGRSKRVSGINVGAGKEFRSNKGVGLAGSGRVMEAVAECKEALRLDPGCLWAHKRLAGLYFRLGLVDKCIHHYKLSKSELKPSEISRAETLRGHFCKCSEARRLRDWQTILTESRNAVMLGADLSPQVFAWQAEALMKLHKHGEAETVMNCAPKFDIYASTKLFGPTVYGYALLIQAQVDMASGRFDEAVMTSQKAMQLDPSNRETTALTRRVQAVASCRSKGNSLFKSSRFQEACFAYSEGLESDPHNAILLCNRAAARAKLRQWEKALEDCNCALRFRPLYAKARLRRADCNSKLKRWKDTIHDLEILAKEIPADKEIEKALTEAKSQLRKRGN